MESDDVTPNSTNTRDDAAATGSAPISPLENAAAKPRLSILHLLVWMATSGAMMALMRLPEDSRTDIPAYSVLGRLAYSMYGGIAIGGVVMWIGRRYRRLPFPTEPGEWLLLVQGYLVLAVIALSFLAPIIDRSSGAVGATIIAILLAGFAAMAIMPAIFYRTEDVWRGFLLVFAFEGAAPLVCFIAGMIVGVGPVVVVFGSLVMLGLLLNVFVFAVAVIVDLHEPSRGWVHWTGVWSLAFAVVLHVASTIVGIYTTY